MAGTPATVEVVGLKALNRDLRRLSSDESGPVVDAMKAAGKKAAEPVAAATRSSLPSESGRLSGSVRTSGTKSGAAVRMGSARVSYAPWIEFGGTRKQPHRSSLPYAAGGHYLFPAASGLAETSARLYSDAVAEALDRFHWTNTGSGESVHD